MPLFAWSRCENAIVTTMTWLCFMASNPREWFTFLQIYDALLNFWFVSAWLVDQSAKFLKDTYACHLIPPNLQGNPFYAVRGTDIALHLDSRSIPDISSRNTDRNVDEPSEATTNGKNVIDATRANDRGHNITWRNTGVNIFTFSARGKRKCQS